MVDKGFCFCQDAPVSQTLLTTAEVAARLKCTPQTVLNYVRSGRLRHAGKLPASTGTYLFDPAVVDAFLAPEPEAVES